MVQALGLEPDEDPWALLPPADRIFRFFLMTPQPPRITQPTTLFPYTTLFRSAPTPPVPRSSGKNFGQQLVRLGLGHRVVNLTDRKSTRLNSSHRRLSRMPS